MHAAVWALRSHTPTPAPVKNPPPATLSEGVNGGQGQGEWEADEATPRGVKSEFFFLLPCDPGCVPWHERTPLGGGKHGAVPWGSWEGGLWRPAVTPPDVPIFTPLAPSRPAKLSFPGGLGI